MSPSVKNFLLMRQEKECDSQIQENVRRKIDCRAHIRKKRFQCAKASQVVSSAVYLHHMQEIK